MSNITPTIEKQVCINFGDDSKDINCGDTNDEFTTSPVFFPVGTQQAGKTYYLKYYQSAIGVKPDDTNSIAGLYVEPTGTDCEKVHSTGGLDNFWRSARYLNITGADNCYLSISQSCPIRNLASSIVEFAYGTKGLTTDETECKTKTFDVATAAGQLAFNSGGFCSDITASKEISFGSQQQFMAKDCSSPLYTGGAWAITLLNCTDSAGALIQDNSNVAVDSEFKNIFIVVNDDDFKVQCPDIDISGMYAVDGTVAASPEIGATIYSDSKTKKEVSTTVSNFTPPAKKLPQDRESWVNFKDVIASSSTTDTIFVFAGLYYIDEDTTLTQNVIGIGMPVILLKAKLTIGKGVQIYSLIFDVFGTFNSDVITFQDSVRAFDVSVRCGGLADTTSYLQQQTPAPTYKPMLPDSSVKINPGYAALRVSGDGCYMENVWIWRADHFYGGSQFPDMSANPADHGLIIDGNNVRAACLQVEHFDKENVIWNGSGGKLVMFQNEIPYYGSAFDTPVLVLNGSGFEGWSIGIYCYFANNPVTVDHTILVTTKASDAKIHSFFNIFLNGYGSITHGLYTESTGSYYGSGASSQTVSPTVNSFGMPDSEVGMKAASPPANWSFTPPGAAAPPSSDAGGQKSSKTWMWVLLIIAGVIFIGTILFFVLRKKKPLILSSFRQ